MQHKMNILITGATGYIGSHITLKLIEEGHNVYATCRNRSVFNRCVLFENDIVWLNQDIDNWHKPIENIDLDLLIHTAWAGVSASDRDNWDVQLTNFYFSKVIIDLSLSLKVKKIICLGSQAEYGTFNYKVSENHVPYPVDAYGAVKLLTLHYLRNIALNKEIEWYWLRVFSLIGENENESWLLPQVMSKLLNGDNIELTEGKQCYDYLYMNDFVKRLYLVVDSENNRSGVYNICSGRAVEIRHLLQLVAEKLKVSDNMLKFGKIAYRENQNMFIVGSTDNFDHTFGKLGYETLDETVTKITSFYKSKME
jgi:nucleoside-diphosphate-sugar epimerase